MFETLTQSLRASVLILVTLLIGSFVLLRRQKVLGKTTADAVGPPHVGRENCSLSRVRFTDATLLIVILNIS